MKNYLRIYQLVLIAFLLTFNHSCQKEEDEGIKIRKNKLSGYVQKGPYINGTSIQMYEMNSSLNQTGKVFSTQIINNRGSFEINDVELTSQFVEFSANGYYFNEIIGEISPSELSLFALSDITDLTTVNVNILNHLEKSRVEYLVANNTSFAAAKDTAQNEILAVFGLQIDEMDNSEILDISENEEENAVLLAISLILQGNRSVGDLTELLANFANDIKQDGELDDASVIPNLRGTTVLLDLTEIRSNLEKRYDDLGISVNIPGFEKYINDFLAFTGQEPSTLTLAATEITTTGATLNGTVNANDLSTTVTFEYGTTTDYGSTAPALQSPVTGHANTSVSAAITDLNPGITYHYRVKSVNSLGTTTGDDMTFITLGEVPSVTTLAATGIDTASVTLNGTVKANFLSSVVSFEYGITTDYGSSATASQSPVTGHENTAVSAAITDLNPSTIYHYRVNSVNSLGTTVGSDMTFTTLGQVPTVATLAATGIDTASVTLNGTVNANDLSSVVLFEYGITTDYGNSMTASQSPVTGHTNTAVSSVLTGLNPGTTYHFRVKSVNSLGTTTGSDMTFKTLGQIPFVVTLAATNTTTTGAQLNGTIIANNLSTQVYFEYGKTLAYGSSVLAIQSPLGGSSITYVSASINNLEKGITYHFRVKATNSLGTVFGDDMIFSAVYNIGSLANGGIVFYIDGTGDHGLVCAPQDQCIYADWGCSGTAIAGADGMIIGTGLQNTTDIISGCPTIGIAAQICYDLDFDGYNDWFLPSLDELALMYSNLKLNGIGNLNCDFYWSSSETDDIYFAWRYNFITGGANMWDKVRIPITTSVRAVRAF